jgi:cobalt-zinc-cadmium efflux system outer membrane protein
MNLQERMLLEHPRIALAEAELERARSKLSYARSGLLPDPMLSGFVAEELDGRNRGLGVSLEVPLWNLAGREIAEGRNTVLMEERALEAIRLDQAIEVSIRLSELRITEASLQLFHEGLLEQAEQSLRISEVSYNQGEISLLDYLDAQRIYYSVLKDYEDTLYAWHLNRAALKRAIGGDLP